MTFIPAADTAEVVMEFTYPEGNKAKNVYNVREANITSWDATALGVLADLFEDWDDTDCSGTRAATVVLTRIVARDISSANGAIVERVVNIPGTVASPPLPANVTFAVKALTGFAGRSFRGRTFWVGLSEQIVTNDTLSTTFVDYIVGAMDALAADLLANGWKHVVVSRFASGAPRTAAVVTDIISYGVTDATVDTQRRRLRR